MAKIKVQLEVEIDAPSNIQAFKGASFLACDIATALKPHLPIFLSVEGTNFRGGGINLAASKEGPYIGSVKYNFDNETHS